MAKKRANLENVLTDDERDRVEMIKGGQKTDDGDQAEEKTKRRLPTAGDLGIRKREAISPKTVYFTDEEHRKLGLMSAKLGCSRSDIVRACVRKVLNLEDIEIEAKKRLKPEDEIAE